MTDVKEGYYNIYSVETFVELQAIMVSVAEGYVPDYADYDMFFVSEDNQEVEVSYSYEVSCECCSYDFGSILVPIEEFNQEIQKRLQ